MSTSLEKEVTPLSVEAALDLATTYRARWPLQENIIKDWLLEMGLDVNHGFAKTAVENSEVAKKRKYLQERLVTAMKRAVSAREKCARALELSNSRCQQLQVLVPKFNRQLRKLYDRLAEEAAPNCLTSEQKMEYKKAETKHKVEIERLDRLERQAHTSCNKEHHKAKEYEGLQKNLGAQLVKLNCGERQMLELDNRKDQVMTVFKLALANLGLWVREQCFPTSYAKCGWSRLLPFFELGGWVSQEPTVVKASLQPFNDRALNRDLAQVCELVNAGELILLDGRQLKLRLEGTKVGQRESCDLSKAVPTPFPISLYSAIAKVG